jgi:catechol 2,3-dioxygenase-like lactoylglutathione lyase family enzyme
MGQDPKLPITAVAPVVADLDRSIQFYRDMLGLELTYACQDFAKFTTAGVNLTLWKDDFIANDLGGNVGKVDGHCRRQMIACHMASKEDVEAAYRRIVGNNIDFLMPPRTFEWGAHAGYFLDPDGNFIELFAWLDQGPLDVVIDTDAPRFPAQEGGPDLTITSVCLFTSDMTRCLNFYTGVMRMQPTRLNLVDGFANFSGSGSDFSLWDLKWTERSIGYSSARLQSRWQGAIIECGLRSRLAVDEVYGKLRSGGVEFISPPEVRGWGAYAAFFADPEGNLWSLSASGAEAVKSGKLL